MRNVESMVVAILLAGCGGARGAAVAVDPSDLAVGDHEVSIDGHQVAFHVAGHGPVCLVQPGGPGLGWTYLRMPEVEASLTLVYVEPVGTGRSGRLSRPDDYSIDRYVRDLDGLRTHLGLAKTCVLGHSHGGLVALSYAVEHPDHLSGLILYGTTAALDDAWAREMRANLRWFDDEHWASDARAGLSEFWTARDDAEATRAFQRASKLYFADWDTSSTRVAQAIAQTHAWAGPARGRGPRFDVSARLSEIHAPTLVLVGRRDFTMSPTAAARLHAGIRGSRLVVLENAGHFAHLEVPAAFGRSVSDFATALPGGGAR